MTSTAIRDIEVVLRDVDVVDTHEHLWALEDLRPGMGVAGFLGHSYLSRSLRTSDGSINGLSDSYRTALGDGSWEAVRDAIGKVRNNAYYRWLMKALADLYDLPSSEFDEATYDYLSAELPRRYADDSWLGELLDRARIRAVVWDPNWRPGTFTSPEARLIPSFRMNSSLVAFHPDAGDFENTNLIRQWAPVFDISVPSLADLEGLIDRLFDENARVGSRSIKSAIAYDRTLQMDPAPRAEAERIFGTSPSRISVADRKLFGDYIIRFFHECARDRGLVSQVHTGLARLSGSNPLYVEPLLQDFPEVTFDLFHGGYPWIHEVAALAHNHPNVRINLTWLPQISTETASAALKEWIQVIPQVDRISWGGDCRTGEETYAALLAAKHSVARAVGDLVDDEYFDLEFGIAVATSIFCDGGARTYGLDVAKSGQASAVDHE